MSKSKSEVGHAKNVENFADLINYCEAYAGDYNPSKDAIKLPALKTKLTSAKASLLNLNTANSDYIVAVNTRQQGFEPLNALATRVINALDASDVQDKIVDDAKTLLRKLRGTRAKTPTAPEPGQDPNINSVSQQSYDQKIENFSKLVTLLKSVPEYTPNEIDLQIPSLEIFVQNLRDKNSEHSTNVVNLSNARIHRDEILYHPSTGLVHLAFEVKKYVKSVFGANSPQFKQVGGLMFKYPPRY